MAKKKKVTTVEEVLADELPEQGLVEDDLLPASVAAFVDELGDDVVRVLLYRRPPNGKQVYCGSLDADEFSLDTVASLYGGGRYLARLRGDTGFLPNRSFTFIIDESIVPTPKPKAASTDAPPWIEKLLDKMLDGRSQKDPMEIAAALGQVAATQAQTTMTALMTAVAPLLAKLTEDKRTTTPAADVLSAVELGLSLGGKDDSYLPVIKEFGPPIVTALQEMTRGRRLPPGQPAQPGGQPVAPTPPVPNPALPEWVQMIAPHIEKVIGFAQRGATPGTVAAALDLQYPRVAQWLETAVLDPTFEPALLQHFPQLQPIRAWVGEFLAEFLPDDPAAGQEKEGGDNDADD